MKLLNKSLRIFNIEKKIPFPGQVLRKIPGKTNKSILEEIPGSTPVRIPEKGPAFGNRPRKFP